MIDQATNEKRRYKRFDAFMELKISTDLHGDFMGTCKSCNLSREGMKVRALSPAAVGEVVDIEITIPGDSQPVYTAGKVMWVNTMRDDSNSQVEMGIKFLMMEPMDKFRMLDYAYNKWLEKKIGEFNTVPAHQ